MVKNTVHLAFGTTSGIGELANALMGVAFVVPAGLIYKYRHSKSGAFLGGAAGALAGAAVYGPGSDSGSGLPVAGRLSEN